MICSRNSASVQNRYSSPGTSLGRGARVVAVMARILPENERALAPFRAEIDVIDREIVELLAKRFEVVRHVIAVKQAEGLAALLPERLEDVVEKVMAIAETKGVPPELVEKLWRVLIAWVIEYENERLG